MANTSKETPRVGAIPIIGDTRVPLYEEKEGVVRVNLLDPDDPLVVSVVWPMVEASFARYTDDGKGNDRNGDQIKLTGDKYDVSGKSKVIVASRGEKVLGSFRVVQADCRPEIQPSIDAMALMTNQDWPSVNQVSFGEFGRFTVCPELPREEQQAVLRSLYREAMKYAETQGFSQQVFVILADHVHHFVTESGIMVEAHPEAVLNEGDPQTSLVFERYPRYWQPGRYYEGTEPPKLYRYLPQMKEI